MKKIVTVVCGLACLICAVARFASAQDALAQGLAVSEKDAVSFPVAMRPVEPGHELGNVTGTDISMKVYDHAVAGAINGAVAWGFFDEATASGQLIMRKYGQVITAKFERQPDKSLGGIITSGEGAGKRSTPVFFAGADPAKNTFKLRINEEEVVVSIVPEGMANGHYVNPTYSAVIGGKPVSYRIEVEGCLGYSINIGMIVLGAYSH